MARIPTETPSKVPTPTLSLSLEALAKIAIGFVDPVLAGRGEEVEVDGVFEGFGGVGKISGDDEDFAGADDFFLEIGLVIAEQEAEGAFEDEGDLFVGVRMAWDYSAFFEADAGEHGLFAVDELAGEKWVERLGSEGVPAGVQGLFRHAGRLSQKFGGCQKESLAQGNVDVE